jgi:GT2 family glycosyltransferase
VEEINSSSIDAADSKRSLERLELAASWHYPPFLRRALPPAFRDVLRELRRRILTYYAFRHLPRHKEFEPSLTDALATASLSIIVPVHDAPEVTRRCLMSLQKYAPKAEIILVDDASKLRESNKLLDEFSNRNRWKLIRHLEPLGHSRACGAGASVATRPILCLLNSDTVATPWCWRPIVQVFEDNPRIGVAGPSTSYSGNLQTLPLAFSTRLYLNDSQICEYARRLLDEYSDSIPTDLPWVSGFAFFIRRSLWEQLGGFDRNLPDYGNDVELCRRLQETGHRVVYVRNSYVHHFAGASYSKMFGAESLSTRTRVALDYIEDKFSRR